MFTSRKVAANFLNQSITPGSGWTPTIFQIKSKFCTKIGDTAQSAPAFSYMLEKHKYLLTERVGRKNMRLEVITYGPKSVRHDREPNIFPSRPINLSQ